MSGVKLPEMHSSTTKRNVTRRRRAVKSHMKPRTAAAAMARIHVALQLFENWIPKRQGCCPLSGAEIEKIEKIWTSRIQRFQSFNIASLAIFLCSVGFWSEEN